MCLQAFAESAVVNLTLLWRISKGLPAGTWEMVGLVVLRRVHSLPENTVYLYRDVQSFLAYPSPNAPLLATLLFLLPIPSRFVQF